MILAPGQRLDHTVVGALPCPTEYTVDERIVFRCRVSHLSEDVEYLDAHMDF